MAEITHQPVLARETLKALAVHADGAYIDATYGRGGHSRLILSQLGPRGRLLAIDRDADAVEHARAEFNGDSRVQIVHAPFSCLRGIIAQYEGKHPILGIVLDLGVSSPQLDQAARGFSFMREGQLDMRMDASSGESAAQWLQHVDEADLVRVLKQLGEERFARRIAGAIVRQRQITTITTTAELAQIIAAAVPRREHGKHPATRSFQAIRIHINRELEELESALPQAVESLAPGGRLVVISFHSLEDRIVKRFIRRLAQGEPLPPDLPIRASEIHPPLRPIGKAIRPSADEISHNPRARSAVLRVAERTEHSYVAG